MGRYYQKDILDCMRDCALSIFWPKEQIISFFKNNNCTTNDIAVVSNYKELNRAEIINMVFEKLQLRNDGGLGQFRSMMKSLLEWDHFDPYYFETLKKLNKNDANKNLSHLKQLREIRDAKTKGERVRRKKLEEEALNKSLTLETLKNRFLNLFQLLDEDGKQVTLQRRGYLFEDFIKELALYEKLQVTDSFKIIGEQIDGAIKFEGQNYIVEAKWHDALTASDALYQFAHKVEGKMYGRGIFILINGYSKDSVLALQNGKALRTILIDGGDLTLIVEGLISFKEVLDKKIKGAQTMGKIYMDVFTMKEKYI